MFVYYGSLLLFLFFCCCWKAEEPRTSPTRGRSNQTNTARSGGLSTVSEEPCSVVQLPTAALVIVLFVMEQQGSWSHLSMEKLVSQSSHCIWISVKGKHCTDPAARFSFPAHGKNLPQNKKNPTHHNHWIAITTSTWFYWLPHSSKSSLFNSASVSASPKKPHHCSVLRSQNVCSSSAVVMLLCDCRCNVVG